MGYNPNITTIYKQVFIHLQKKPLILTSCNIQVVQVVQFSHRFPRPRGLPGLSFSFATLGTLCTFSACFAVTTHVNDRWEGPGVCGKEDKGSVLIGSMYGIVTCIWLKFMMNVGKYTIHGCYGVGFFNLNQMWYSAHTHLNKHKTVVISRSY